MNRWDRREWYPVSRKKPPPEHGIRIKKAGTTWWGQRWIAALEGVLGGQAGRLARGRTYARAGRTHDLVVHGGEVTAKVTGSRPEPYEVVIRLSQLSDAQWAEAIAGMASKAQFSAELLGGEMPKDIDEVFRVAGVSLFPSQRAELVTRCSCPDWGDPCKHVAATHYVLGEALDRDPFLLFELRGRTKDAVLAALRAARGGLDAAHSDAGSAPDPRAPDVPTVSLGKLRTSAYDRPREPLPALRFAFDAPSGHGAVLRQLGTPAAWTRRDSPAHVLEPLVRAAAEAARRIALADPASREHPPQHEATRDAPVRTPQRPAKKSGKAAATKKPAKKSGKAAATKKPAKKSGKAAATKKPGKARAAYEKPAR